MSKFTKTDALFREVLLKERGEVCEKCRRHMPVQVSHILSKGAHPRLRYQRQNVLLLCVFHHLFWWHKSPLEAQEWVKFYKGEALLDDLRILERALPKVDLKLLNMVFKEALK